MTITTESLLKSHGIGLSDEELAHVGVKGMRWGKRKRQEKADEKANTAVPKLDLKTASDDDLKKSINRLKMEKEYKTLTAPQVSEGRKIIAEILKDVGKQQAKAYLNNEVDKMIKGGAKGALKAAGKGLVKAAAPAPARQIMQLSPRR